MAFSPSLKRFRDQCGEIFADDNDAWFSGFLRGLVFGQFDKLHRFGFAGFAFDLLDPQIGHR